MKKISIITINYNNIQGLVKTVESVINQTFKDYEYLIIDGGSTDGSKAYIECISPHLDYWVSEPDKGIYNAMNKGIKKATGEYLLFLNSGDYFVNQIVLEEFTSHSNFIGNFIYGDYKFEKFNYYYPDKLSPSFFMKSSLPHQATFIKRNIFEAIGLYEEKYKIVSDRAFFIKAFLTNRFVFTHVPILVSFFDQSGISNNSKYVYLKNEEDTLMLKELFDIYYEDLFLMKTNIKELNFFKDNSIKGIMKRILFFLKLRKIKI